MLLHILYISITEMRIYYVKIAPYTCFSNISVHYAVANGLIILISNYLYMLYKDKRK